MDVLLIKALTRIAKGAAKKSFGSLGYDAGTILYHGGDDFDINKKWSYYTKDLDYAKKYADHHRGEIHKVKLKRAPKIFTYKDDKPVWWQEVDDWLNSIIVKGYDAILVLEPHNDTSLCILNPDILEAVD
jgi:hypothetical protein